jgi:beta-aspartyl-peptidase (threonine type)
MTRRQSSCLADALATGYAILEQGGPAVVAVEVTIGFLEQSGLFNAGRGAKRQLDGVQRMDASLMEGAGLRAGAVASLEGFVHPITAARLVMEETTHVLLAGPLAGNLRSISVSRDIVRLEDVVSSAMTASSPAREV